MSARPLPEKFLVAFSFAGEQRDLVRAVAEAVEKQLGHGTVFFDEWFEHYLAGDDADLKLQKIYGEDCELAVVCVSEQYGGKPWTKAEHRAIRARQMRLEGSKNTRDENRIMPVRVGDGEIKGILFNAIVLDIRNRTPSSAAQLVLDRLDLIIPPTTPRTARDWPTTAPELLWPLADHHGAREAFGLLLTRSAPWSFLRIRGASETGKSHLTRQMLANLLGREDIACGRFDFKGTTDVERELTAFAQHLQLDLPPAEPQLRLNERLCQIWTELKSRSVPTVLIFDTYESAGEAQKWVEEQLLPNLLRNSWLRVIIAGQRVPSSNGAIWLSKAKATIELTPPRTEDWFDFGKQHRVDLTLHDVEVACKLAQHKASLLAELLGPSS